MWLMVTATASFTRSVVNDAWSADVDGSLPWAVAQANVTGGTITWPAEGYFEPRVETSLRLTGQNITIDAPLATCSLLRAIRSCKCSALKAKISLSGISPRPMRYPDYTNADNNDYTYSSGSATYPLVAGQTVFNIPFDFVDPGDYSCS